MMMFNVEDLLALPQLKQGKLPKNITEINIKEAFYEVADIMDFQMSTKKIQIEMEMKGFGEQEDC